jgi:parallel beta-helix repeat protein
MTIRILLLVVLLQGFSLTAAGARGGPTSASAACPSEDDTFIAGAIAAAKAFGGGRVDLPAGLYEICKPIELVSNVHLHGAGPGATVLRTARALSGPPLTGLGTIYGRGVNNVSVSDLTLDHRTNSTLHNGIAFVPANTDFSGTVSSNIRIQNTEVLGTPVVGGHQYMIWNMRGQNVKIVNNWVDGGFSTPPSTFTPQEGIESYGGVDVVVTGNTVEGIGTACLNFGSAGHPNTHTVGLLIQNNYAVRCGVGLNIGTANPVDPQINAHSIITGNVFVDVREAGIKVVVAPGTAEQDLYIAGNTIQNVGPSSWVSDGILLFAGSGGTTIVPTRARATMIRDNRIHNVQGIGFGIRLWTYPNARIIDNSIVNVAREGIYAESSRNLEIRGNRIVAAGLVGIVAGSWYYWGEEIANQIIVGNTLVNWGADAAGIRMFTTRYGIVKDNIFRRSDAARPTPIVMMAGCGVTVEGNLALYPESVSNQSSPPCP